MSCTLTCTSILIIMLTLTVVATYLFPQYKTRLFVMLFDVLSDRGRFTHLLPPSNIMSYHRSKSVHRKLDIFYCLDEFEVFIDLYSIYMFMKHLYIYIFIHELSLSRIVAI